MNLAQVCPQEGEPLTKSVRPFDHDLAVANGDAEAAAALQPLPLLAEFCAEYGFTV